MLTSKPKQDNKKIIHELNNEGCLCLMCQKLIIKQNKKIHIEKIADIDSEEFQSSTKEYYIKIVKQMVEWEKQPRKLRYLLPQICLYSNANPIERISKRKERGGILHLRDKSKMHMFEIIHFFLEGFIYHKTMPQKQLTNIGLITNKKPLKNKQKGRKNSGQHEDGDEVVGIYSQKYKNECIVIGKYRNNFFNMFTLNQMENLFKSRQKYLRQGLLYLQTLVGIKANSQINININLRSFLGTQIYEHAKKQARMIFQQIKPSDMDFISEQQQIEFENQLKNKSHRQYLQYLSLKIILLSSLKKELIITKAVFKFILLNGYEYIWDIRVDKLENSDQFWAAGMMKAYQYRLHKRMSMMEMDPASKMFSDGKKLGYRAQQLQGWLEKSTSMQWSEMSVIRNRLERLQKEKRSLMQSQSFTQGQNKSMFKIRSLKK